MAPRASTREALLGAAEELLAAGQDDASVAAITTTAGVGVGSFYNHFDDKDSLFELAARAGIREVRGRTDPADRAHREPGRATVHPGEALLPDFGKPPPARPNRGQRRTALPHQPHRLQPHVRG